jgi:sarcosine oxidase subunit alpha
VIDAGATPGYQLALHAGAKLGFDDARQAFTLSNLPEGLRLAGSVAGHHTPASVIRSGEMAGAEAARALGLQAPALSPLPDPEAAWHRTYPVPAACR